MKTAVFTAPRRIEIREVPLPHVGRRQIRVRLEGCGLCASNVPVWEGRPWFEYPREPGSPGHEGWGIVDQAGEAVTAFQAGDRVAMISHHAFAQYDVVDADQAVLLPASLQGHPAPGEPLGCAVNIFNRSGIAAGRPVAIIGIGFLGTMLVQLAARAGAEVIAVSRRAWALEMAGRCGAQHQVPFETAQQVGEQVRRVVGRDGCSCVIEAVGNQAALDVASELVGVRGRLVIAGFHQDGLRHVNMQSWNWRGIDVINAHERDPHIYVQGMREAFQLIAAGQFEPQALMTHAFPLEHINAAFEMSTLRPDGFLKALIRME